ncbi:hypothetical protein GJU39_20680 [Pedobacter petrophilus]|uniref:Uncharacterized protein n=1 Tax=Pedobacter petrophilus TaxID=1908241 RepID=A0A7K0G5J5_9SPHI|nr:hypothetical protein [Pedobacter petrophilus]MRX78499.1 hypothetical protein [Pedobacter petrophilus]
MKTQELFFIVRIEVETAYEHLSDTLKEMEETSRFLMTNSPKVKVVNSEILTTKTRNLKNSTDGA